jgi:hypothetical protein
MLEALDAHSARLGIGIGVDAAAQFPVVASEEPPVDRALPTQRVELETYQLGQPNRPWT